GYMPADGAKADGDWVGFADVSGMPQIFKPAKHWVANANNKLVSDGYPLSLGREWGYHGRIAQIVKALDQTAPINLDAMQAIQYDVTSPIAQTLLPIMLEQLQGAELDAGAKALQSRLQNWDLKTGMEAPEPLIFFAWMRETIRLVFQDELGPSFDGWFSLRAAPLERVLNDRPVWCDDIRAAPIEDCPMILARALTQANTWLQDKYGDDPADWSWGEAHP
ncbi:MAG: penicillin acylase family protein, partial [Alphaproteobacteria bacterium]